MSNIHVYERAKSFSDSLARRGHHIVYRANTSNQCPGCGRSQWYVGRISAECGYCATAVPLAEARLDRPLPAVELSEPGKKVPRRAQDARRWPRMGGEGRDLQLLIDGSPTRFALQNISAGGVMGDAATQLAPGAEVVVRFENGVFVPATVRWCDDGLVGLAFNSPVLLDSTAQ